MRNATREMGTPIEHGPLAAGSAAWAQVVAQSQILDQAEKHARYGRWWLAHGASEFVLSVGAAGFLGVEPGAHADALSCFGNVVQDDLPTLTRALRHAEASGDAIDCQFRAIDPVHGLRWLHLLSIDAALPAMQSGMLIDITFTKHAAMRERFNFALTQYLIGANTNTLGEAVTKIIQLVCEDLGWEWGAYWAFDVDASGVEVLCCKNFWHGADQRLASFKRDTETIHMLPGQGLVGRVWQTGQAQWIDGVAGDPDYLRGEHARECGLLSGYMFPVTYVTPDGVLHSPGVLEFFSNLPRQREAQLPDLSASISALIAQTAQRMVQQERIRRLAMSDEMTGLANRTHFHLLLDDACAQLAPGQSFGVLYIDLDQFKPVNDAFGHEAGNVVLVEFARRLQALTPAGFAIGRLGGDEFAMLATPGVGLDELDDVAEAVLHAARAPFIYDGNELSVSASIGISICPTHGTSTAELLHAADAAMYLSKRNGRNLVSHFSGDAGHRQSKLAEQLTLLSELHYAQARNEFFLDYQPIFDTFGNRVMAVEALIRWRKSNGEIVPPDRFIPIAEQSRLIVHLGRWVVEQVCRDLPMLSSGGMERVQVHINMAAPEFLDSELPRQLISIANAANIDPHRICLELTEGVVMNRMEKSIPIMHELQRYGFEISLDDFGMGYSSLAMLKKLPISSLKIDRLFVSGLPHDRADSAIVRTILDLGRQMKIRVIAEGVETDAQLGFLRQFGCPQVQGYLLGRPKTLGRLIAEHGPHSEKN